MSHRHTCDRCGSEVECNGAPLDHRCAYKVYLIDMYGRFECDACLDMIWCLVCDTLPAEADSDRCSACQAD